MSPAFPDIWQCVEILWQHLLKTKVPVTGLGDYLREQGRTEASYPGVPPIDKALAALLLPQLSGWSTEEPAAFTAA